MTVRSSHRLRAAIAAGTLGLTALLVAGCSSPSSPAAAGAASSSSDASRPAVQRVDKAAAALVPESVRKDGKLTIAADTTSAPDVFLSDDGKTMTGWQVDLAYQLTDVLDIKPDFVKASIPTIIPGLENGRYEMSIATFGITPDRLKVLDFVGNFAGGGGFLTTADSKLDFGGIGDLCGRHVGVIQGTLYVDETRSQSTKCEADGKSAVDVQQFPDKNAAALAVSSKRVDILFADGTTTGYMVKQAPDAYKEVGKPFYLGVAGNAFPKDSGMAKAVQAALQDLIDSGAYEKTLKEYGVDSGALSKATVNDPDAS